MSVLSPTAAALRTMASAVDLLYRLQEELTLDEDLAHAVASEPILARGLETAAITTYQSVARIQTIVDMARGSDAA